MKIQSFNNTKNFIPNFRGDIAPKVAFKMEDCSVLNFVFDPSNDKGDSVEFANTFAKDCGVNEVFNGNKPQKVYLDGRCIFDSKNTAVMVYSDTGSDNVIFNVFNDEDQFPKTLQKESTEFKDTGILIKKLLIKLVNNSEENAYKEFPFKGELFDTCIDLLKKLKKLYP